MILVRGKEMRSRWSAPHHRPERKVLLSPALPDVPEGLSIGMVTIPAGGTPLSLAGWGAR